MIEATFRGVTQEEGTFDICACDCFPASTSKQTSNHQGENSPTCKCTCYCQQHKSKSQKKGDTSQTTYESNTA